MFRMQDLIQSLEVATASVSRGANILQWRVQVSEVVGQAEGRRQESRNKHLTDLREASRESGTQALFTCKTTLD